MFPRGQKAVTLSAVNLTLLEAVPLLLWALVQGNVPGTTGSGFLLPRSLLFSFSKSPYRRSEGENERTYISYPDLS
jgi:hypothetical protein